MQARPLVMLCAALLLGSIFLPWLSGPLGNDMVPWDAVSQLNGDQINQVLSELPPEGLAFVASFAFAALIFLLGLMGSAPRLLVLITGALPVGLVGWALFQATRAGQSSPIPVTGDDISQILQQLAEVLGPGAWMWLGGGAVLLLLSLFAPSRS